MFSNKRTEIIHEVQLKLWLDKVNDACLTGRFTKWISNFHSEKLPCQIEGGFLHGSYNLGQKLTFSDGTSWLARFPVVGNLSDKYTDEKVAMEVEVLSLIREKTTIPVPHIKAWGVAADNSLGLGPFIIMEFIQGVSTNHFLKEHNKTRLLCTDISGGDIEYLYRQFDRILLQLFKLDFARIGSLPKTRFPVPIRPLTFKVHDILQTGGVDKFGDRSKGFSTTTEYFQYVLRQDWEQLLYQPNSVDDEYTGRAKYKSLSILKALIPDFVEKDYEHGPFKLICDDLGLANLIVKSENDRTIVGVIDLEWSYIGPAQLFGSAPWWLLQDRLNNWDRFLDEKDFPQILDRYLRYLEIFKRVLEEEEEKISEKKELSDLVRRAQASGTIWFHMLFSWGFNHPDTFPFIQLKQHLGKEKWEQLQKKFPRTKEMDKFIEQKLIQLEQYEQELDKTKEDKNKIENGKMTEEEFIATL